ncbi:MAG: hypothetical protein Q9160_007058 [Pyrenula sp. 1 TL-2023]
MTSNSNGKYDCGKFGNSFKQSAGAAGRTPKSANPQFLFSTTKIHERSFWGKRRDVVRSATLRYQLDVLHKTGRYNASKLQWHPIYAEPVTSWPVPKHLFWDSDVAKWIEGACYFLDEQDDPDIEVAVKELVGMIGDAQQADGYINIHYTVVEPGKRFTNLRDMHELYNAGHLIEAALAHQQHFKNHDLLGPLLKYVELLCRVFGGEPGQLRGYPGHPEIELALLRIYKVSGDERHAKLARFFLDERGNPSGFDGQHYYAAESKRRGDVNGQMPVHYPYRDPYRYQQAHLPIMEQLAIEGHSVRAMYLLTAVADLCIVENESNERYRPVLLRLWENMVQRKMYLTGGIGAIHQWEGFGIDYFLPQGSAEGGCYAETCAAIGVVMLAERLLQLDLDGKYADILELCLYNAVLTGMSSDGKAFTYTNQLASSDGSLSKREEWFECACCPPNVLRTLGVLGGYIWTYHQAGNKSVDVNVHLYCSASLETKTDGSVVSVTQIESTKGYTWAGTPEKGYVTITSQWLSQNNNFKLSIPLQPRLISPHPMAGDLTSGLARGSLVYCVEDVDNPWVNDHFKTTYLDTAQPFLEEERTDIIPSETCIGIKIPKGAKFLKSPEQCSPLLHRGIEMAERTEDLRFIPFYARANRKGKGMMRVALKNIART